MSDAMVAFATGEGQTRKVASFVANELEQRGIHTQLIDLAQGEPPDCLQQCDGVLLAASVHAGKHQTSASKFAQHNKDALSKIPNTFLSVNLSNVAGDQQGDVQAKKQIDDFIELTGWEPKRAIAVAGAFRYSEFSRVWRWIIRTSQRLFARSLNEQGWPPLTEDQEYTDWQQLREFADDFAGQLSSCSTR